jgi:hypothetical protein
MWKRTLWAVALALVVGVCKEPSLATSAIAGVGDVSVLDVRRVPSGEAPSGASGNPVTYILATVALTNNTNADFTPAVTRFFLTDAHNARYAGMDSGSSAFVGIANSQRSLKKGEKRAYTVGFRAPDPLVTGTVSYEP